MQGFLKNFNFTTARWRTADVIDSDNCEYVMNAMHNGRQSHTSISSTQPDSRLATVTLVNQCLLHLYTYYY